MLRRAFIVTALVTVSLLAAPAQAWSKCSVCEWIVGELTSKGSCDAVKDGCHVLPDPWGAVCDGIVDCCCGMLLKFIQEHLRDAAKICHDVHMCSTASKGEVLLALIAKAKQHYGVTGGPMLPAQLASNVAGTTWDAVHDFNASYAATLYDDFAMATRRADWSTFGDRGTRWITKANTDKPEVIEQRNGNCTARTDYVNPPFVAEQNFWVNATYEGREYRTVIGPVDKFTRLTSQGYFVGFFRPDTKLPAEVWTFYKDHFRTIDVISGNAESFAKSELTPCKP